MYHTQKMFITTVTLISYPVISVHVIQFHRVSCTQLAAMIYALQEIEWHGFELEESPINEDADTSLQHFAASRTGRLVHEAFL